MMIVRTEVHENNDMFSHVMHIVSIDMYGFTGVVVSAIYLILLLKINATFFTIFKFNLHSCKDDRKFTHKSCHFQIYSD